MTYPGGKNAAGVYQAIINQMPPHRVYVEPFLGGGAVMKRKRPAARNVGIDRDRQVTYKMRSGGGPPGVEALTGCGIDWLCSVEAQPDWLIYCDPPYLIHARRSQRPIYKFEMSVVDHRRLLRWAIQSPSMVMISGYADPLYFDELADWRCVTFNAPTRGGRPALEHLWCNFPPPDRLHDYSFLGRDYRERERIRRKLDRWRAKLAALPPLERQAIIESLRDPLDVSGDAGYGTARIDVPRATPEMAMPPATTRPTPLEAAIADRAAASARPAMVAGGRR